MLFHNKTVAGYTRGTQESIQQHPPRQPGKNEYLIDLEEHEKQYCLGTESGLYSSTTVVPGAFTP
jgi:hypothetical protein